ncbi:MAG: hypothetical protein WCG83_02935 [Candidatus Peregrinibacteria bacterium]
METPTPTSIHDRVLLTWTAPARPMHERGRTWYIVAGSILAALLLYALFNRDWSFALVLLAITTTFLALLRLPHQQHTMTIGERGFQWNHISYGWSECAGYWMLQGKGYVELHIELSNPSKSRLIIQTGELEIGDIDAVLARFLPYLHNRRERLLDYFYRICKL